MEFKKKIQINYDNLMNKKIAKNVNFMHYLLRF